MKRLSDPLQNLADALSEDVGAASPAALAAEAAQERGTGDAFALDFDRIVVRAERQARWRRSAQRLRAFAAALAWRPSWRPVLATVASLAVIVVAGDLFLYQRASAPMGPVMSTSTEFAPRPAADRVAPQASLEAERDAARKSFESTPVAPAPPPAPAADIAHAPKPVPAVPVRVGEAAHNPPAAPPAARARARAAPSPSLVPDRNAALSLAEEQNSRAATVERKAASQPSAPQTAAVPSAPAPATGAASGGLASPSFIWPLRGELVAGFGDATNGRHNDGIDIAVPAGSDIHAADDGVVVYASADTKGDGNLVLLRHGDGFVTAYAHAGKMLVKLHDVVHRGQVIAKSGVSSSERVPLLHFEIRKGSTPVDPAQYLPKS